MPDRKMIEHHHLVPLFKTEVADRASEIDPSSEQDWFSITLGWAIAKGLSVEDAHEFATHLRYGTSLA